MKNSEILACLNHVPIFLSLNAQEKLALTNIARHVKYTKDEFIYMAGDELDALYIVHAGQVKIMRYTADGKEQVLRILKHGDFFGEDALFINKAVNNFAEITDSAVICKIDQHAFLNIMDKIPAIAPKMLKELSMRLDAAEETLIFNNLKTATAKLAKYLLDHAIGDRVIFTTTKKNISGELGISAETFSRTLQQLNTAGHIKIIRNKEIVITNRLYLLDLVNL